MTTTSKAAIEALKSAAADLDALSPGAPLESFKTAHAKMSQAITKMKEAMKTERFTSEGQEAMAAGMVAMQNEILKLLTRAESKADDTRTTTPGE